MTEPDEALLWARGAGMPIYQHHTLAEAYRAGAAASAERIKELEARVAELERRLSGVPVAPPPPPTGPAYDPRPIATCFDYARAVYGGRGGGGQG